MDVQLIKPVVETLINVFSTMADVRPDVGKPSLKKDEIARGDVTGIMSMVSPQLRASVAITFTKPVIINLVRRMLGEEIRDINDTACDLTGELTNMVVGGAKNLFASQGYDFDMSTPSILIGKGHLVHHPFSGETILLLLTADSGQFCVEICLEDR